MSHRLFDQHPNLCFHIVREGDIYDAVAVEVIHRKATANLNRRNNSPLLERPVAIPQANGEVIIVVVPYCPTVGFPTIVGLLVYHVLTDLKARSSL
jgi:hypothetical protein